MGSNQESTDLLIRFFVSWTSWRNERLWADNYTPMMPEAPFDLDRPSTPETIDFGGVELWLAGKNTQDRSPAEWIRQMVQDEKASVSQVATLAFSSRIGNSAAS